MPQTDKSFNSTTRQGDDANSDFYEAQQLARVLQLGHEQGISLPASATDTANTDRETKASAETAREEFLKAVKMKFHEKNTATAKSVCTTIFFYDMSSQSRALFVRNQPMLRRGSSVPTTRKAPLKLATRGCLGLRGLADGTDTRLEE